ncbi:17403_t:CDS:2 [Dentiscutata erythropus]|uniref:17403_t:CDS:1 n=1 Tax=Dentiscutata erythropus TaxID=1348616 RepID=A0A9N9BID2_9GLOM|nr:17403_t:CDS:2 [Dentiscutata erythropus]
MHGESVETDKLRIKKKANINSNSQDNSKIKNKIKGKDKSKGSWRFSSNEMSNDEVDIVKRDRDCENDDIVITELVVDKIINNKGLNNERSKDHDKVVELE